MQGLRRTAAQLQGIPLPVSELESSILSARLKDYSPGRLDQLIRTGEVLWQGSQSLGRHDGQVALHLKQDFPLLGRISVFAPGDREQQIRQVLVEEAGLEFERIAGRLGGFEDDLLKTLWKLAWNGELTSDSLDALRARGRSTPTRHRRRPRYAARKGIPPGAAGRWTLLSGPRSGFSPETERELARASQLLDRYGIVCRDTLAGEDVGIDAVAPLLEKLEARGLACRQRLPEMEETGDTRFLAPGADAVWRAAKDDPACGVLAACDPANPFGLLAPWPRMAAEFRPQRSPGARVLFADGKLVGYLTRTGRGLYTPEGDGDFVQSIRLLKRSAAGHPVFLEIINGEPPYQTPWHRDMVAAGFSPSRRGYLLRTDR